MNCNKCGSDKIQVVSKVETMAPWAKLIWWFGIICTLGILYPVYKLFNRTHSTERAVCVGCGNKWAV